MSPRPGRKSTAFVGFVVLCNTEWRVGGKSELWGSLLGGMLLRVDLRPPGKQTLVAKVFEGALHVQDSYRGSFGNLVVVCSCNFVFTSLGARDVFWAYSGLMTRRGLMPRSSRVVLSQSSLKFYP